MEKTCKNCIFWTSEEYAHNETHRDCKLFQRYSYGSPLPMDSVIYNSTDDHGLICKTGKDFGCINFKENDVI